MNEAADETTEVYSRTLPERDITTGRFVNGVEESINSNDHEINDKIKVTYTDEHNDSRRTDNNSHRTESKTLQTSAMTKSISNAAVSDASLIANSDLAKSASVRDQTAILGGSSLETPNSYEVSRNNVLLK